MMPSQTTRTISTTGGPGSTISPKRCKFPPHVWETLFAGCESCLRSLPLQRRLFPHGILQEAAQRFPFCGVEQRATDSAAETSSFQKWGPDVEKRIRNLQKVRTGVVVELPD